MNLVDVLIPKNIVIDQLPTGDIKTFNGTTMGTTWQIDWVETKPNLENKLQHAIKQTLSRIIQQMSHWESQSDLSQFNQAPQGWYQQSTALIAVLSCGLEVAKKSNGAYNPAMGQLVNLWGFGAKKRYDHQAFCIPNQSQIEKAKQRCNWQQLEIDAQKQSVYQPENVYLDFSGIAKGFAVDELARLFKQHQIDNFLIEIGGELSGYGIKPNGQPWWVDVERPPSLHINTHKPSRIALHNLAIATSGNYRQNFTRQHQHYSHTIDPRTGYPIQNGIISCTVVHPSCMYADAYATAITVLGVEQGIEFANQHHIATQLISQTNPSTSALKITQSKAWQAMKNN